MNGSTSERTSQRPTRRRPGQGRVCGGNLQQECGFSPSLSSKIFGNQKVGSGINKAVRESCVAERTSRSASRAQERTSRQGLGAPAPLALSRAALHSSDLQADVPGGAKSAAITLSSPACSTIPHDWKRGDKEDALESMIGLFRPVDGRNCGALVMHGESRGSCRERCWETISVCACVCARALPFPGLQLSFR